MKRIVAWTGLVVLVLVGLYCWALMLRPAWIEPIEGVRLEPARPLLRACDVQPDSAYDLFRRAIALPPFDYGSVDAEWKQMQNTGWSEAYTNLASLMAAGASNLDLARRAALAPDPQVPTVTNFDIAGPNLSDARMLARLLQAEAYRKSAAGDYRGAASNLMLGIRFGAILSRGGCLVYRLVSNEIGHTELTAMRKLSVYHDWPHPLLRVNIHELETIDAHLEPYAECVRYEYIGMQFGIDMVYSGEIDKMLGLRGPSSIGQAIEIGAPFLGCSRSETQRNMRYVYGHLIALAEKGYNETIYRHFQDQMAVNHSVKTLLLHRDPIGYLLAGMLVSNTGTVHAYHLSLMARLRATRLALALQLYRDEEGEWPEALAALIPNYLDAVPADPFDGRPLRYRRFDADTWRVYSVGRNGRDDGGVGDTNTPLEGLDLVFTSE